MKIAKGLMPFLLFILMSVTFLTGCSHVDKTDVEAVITNELNLLKNLDSDTTQKYVSYKELFPDTTQEIELSKEVKEVFSLFFRDFDYKIRNVDVDNDTKEASVSLQLSTLDARTLAKDYAQASLETAILKAAASDTSATEETTDSLEERYLIIDSLLKKSKYETVTRDCTMTLQNTGSDHDEWEIQRSHSLENDLVGGLISYLSDNNLLSPEETLTIYLNTLKSMNTEQMGNYLGIESLLNTSDSDKNSIASALVEQVHQNFDFKITNCEEQGYTATVSTTITTFDSASILNMFSQEQDAYLSSADAVIDGSEKRYQKSLEMLLNDIKNNTANITSTADFHLTNDGVSWKLDDSNTTIGNAIFGTLSNSPVSEETEDADSSEDDSYAEESED
ncbi:hypothetical protein [Blautia sp. Marseille-P3087]|uniref:hypothetical protein n=1 Tax=Blautia sp. Marseille-P3087 TaxID=1917876 RepID=UPI0009311FE6|nr:hypothetical protein [Blautia sp. Marseille-P3087]